MKILLTGATGFLGSHIAEALLAAGYELLLTRRTNSDLSRCNVFVDQVRWTNTDFATFELDVYAFQPSVKKNAAWAGVSAKDRDIWSVQLNNLQYQQRLLDLAVQVGVKKIIGVGSQAEYGIFDGLINESHPTNPTSAYGASKLAGQLIMRTFCEEHEITWYWFRLFSCFGEKEAENWLIPAAIKNMMFNDHMDLTAGEQQYSYLYIKDVVNVFLSAVDTNAANGVYHIASDHLRSLKSILLTIKDYLNPNFQLNFGTLPYRKNQSMINGSINDKTHKTFGFFETSDFSKKLIQTIEFYKNIYNDRK